MSKVAKKTAKKATEKVAQKAATPQVPTAPVNLPPSGEALAAMLGEKPTTPQEANEQLTAMLRRLISESSRHEAQIQYVGRVVTDSNLAISDHTQYLEQCIRLLFDQMHLDMPKRQPAVVDAVVELVAESELAKGEQLDMRCAWSSKAHPVRGNYEVILNNETCDLKKFHPKVVARLVEAFGQKINDGTIVDGEFYYVRLRTLHNEPVDDSSVLVDRNLQPVAQGAG